jgi:hypothetical protein
MKTFALTLSILAPTALLAQPHGPPPPPPHHHHRPPHWPPIPLPTDNGAWDIVSGALFLGMKTSELMTSEVHWK